MVDAVRLGYKLIEIGDIEVLRPPGGQNPERRRNRQTADESP
jgi:hypothetical protein